MRGLQPPDLDGANPRERRKRLGAWYTPPSLVDHVVGLALAGAPREGRVRVLDPACGDGRFLAAVRDRLGERAQLMGIDIDEAAVDAARAALPGAEIVHADALTRTWSGVEADVVIGNPPFLGQMATATTRGGSSRWGGGPYADAAAEFLALAVTVVRPGGAVALVLPQSVLTARDAGPIRSAARERAAIEHVWWSDRPMFDAHVHTCAVVLRAGAAQGEVSRSFGAEFAARPTAPLGPSWGSLLLDEPHDHIPADPGAPTLGDIAEVAVDFRDQYYGLVGAVGDEVDGPPLVTSGLIDPGVCHWSVRTVRFAKQRFEAPRVALDRLTPAMQRWAERRLVPKVLVANQTRVIEAVLDADGIWLPSVPVLTVTGDDLGRITDTLDSAHATTWVRARAAGSGLSPQSLRLTPALLAGIPLA